MVRVIADVRVQGTVRRQALLVALITGISGCGNGEISAAICDTGADAARNGDYEQAVINISTCLAIPDLSIDSRADALEARAWSYSNLKRHALAVEDQEAAYRLRAPSEYRQFINSASYLRRVGRVQDSLNAVLAAESMEGGTVSMMTQYNKGWSLLELGRHREAVDAFTKGIPIQPDYVFVYWHRGLAYKGLATRSRRRPISRDLRDYLSRRTT